MGQTTSRPGRALLLLLVASSVAAAWHAVCCNLLRTSSSNVMDVEGNLLALAVTGKPLKATRGNAQSSTHIFDGQVVAVRLRPVAMRSAPVADSSVAQICSRPQGRCYHL